MAVMVPYRPLSSIRNVFIVHLRLTAILFAACVLLTQAGTALAQPTIPILVYHRFDPVRLGLTTIQTTAFQQQLDWLDAHHYKVIPLQAVAAWLGGTGPAPTGQTAVITVDDGNVSVFTQLYPIILRRHLHVTLFIYPSAISNAAYALTWEQLAEMENSGLVDVQSHTYWHPNFHTERAHRTPADYSAFVDFQLSRSRAVLERRLGIKVTMLAWPYGIFDPQLEAAARQAGYLYAFAFAGGQVHPGDDLLAIPRIPISGFMGVDTFAALVAQPLAGKKN